jgi:hypothetical protein
MANQSSRDHFNALKSLDRSMRRAENAPVFSAVLAVGVTFGIAYAYAHMPHPGPSFPQTSPAPARTPDTPPPLAPLP